MRFRLCIIALYLLGFGRVTYAAPCSQIRSDPDAWVTNRVAALVQSARAAYERDEANQAYRRVLKRIADTIQRCNLSVEEPFVSRYREFFEYIAAVSLDQLPGHELGFITPDEQYFQETRQFVEIPDFLLTQDFLRVVSRDETLDRAKSLLRLMNLSREGDDQLLFFSYQSRHLGTPDNDNSFERLLIVVPGNVEKGIPDKWVQFGVTDRRARVRIRNVSVVSAVVSSDGTYNTYFKDYYRTYRRDGSISINGRWELGYGDDNCVKCHKSGILPIFPEAGSVRPKEQEAVTAVNERFLTYGSPRFGNYLDASKFGPGLGSPRLGSSAQVFKATSRDSILTRAVTCAACHKPAGLGSLSWPMDETLISSFVIGGQMPLGYKLKVSEREKLYDRLIQEYFATDKIHPGVLESWLLGKLR